MTEKLKIHCIDKPAGFLTHGDGRGFVGITEYESFRLNKEFKIIHRLDKETSGVLLVVEDRESAEKLSELWQAGTTDSSVAKIYRFLTDKKPQNPFEEIECDTPIDGKTALSKFTRLKSLSQDMDLYEVQIFTGRTHQIRRHAREIGISILGDEIYGGSADSRVHLHCYKIIVEEAEFISPQPLFFERPEIFTKPLKSQKRLSIWLEEYDRRLRLYPDFFEGENSVRIIHCKENGLYCDRLGDTLWFYVFDELNQVYIDDLLFFAKLIGFSKYVIRPMPHRRAGSHEKGGKRDYTEASEKWTIREGDIKFEMRAESGWSPGLFLDQRQNRKWVLENSSDLNVLNLFCYTGGFSLAAAVGGAKSVTSVDVSKNYISWTKRNFELNSEKISQFTSQKHEFWPVDARQFLKGAIKRKHQFDLIICDPPSFGRSKTGVFKIEKDFHELFLSLTQVASENAKILFSLNYEKWTTKEFSHRLDLVLKELSGWRQIEAPLRDFDFELPDVDTNMKYFMISNARP